MQEQLPATIAPTYYQQRMQALGVNDANNVIKIWQSTRFGEEGNGENILKPLPIFRESEKGIDIIVYTLDRNLINYNKEGKRWKDHYCITRLEVPIKTATGGEIKYLKPKSVPSYPFFPPKLVDAYDSAVAWKAENPGKRLPTDLKVLSLYLTEGFFKAFKADLSNIMCVGVQSISTLREKETNTIWSDIVKLVTVCEVERIVWLTDGDYMNITSKDLTDGIDLYKRPHNFYNSAYTFYELTSNLKDVNTFFAHINTESLTIEGTADTKPVPGPKGLDDLLCTYPNQLHSIATEFNNFSIMAPGKVYPGQWITRINIGTGVARVRQYMHLDDVNRFYVYHSEKRPKDFERIKTFVFNGTTYKWNPEKSVCEVEIPSDAADYMRVGNDYYKNITVPDKYERQVPTIQGRSKGTIADDHGKNIFQHIAKYNAFTVVPNHMNWQKIIHNCYNLYHPFVHEAEEGECDTILDFIKHVFGCEPVSWEDEKDGLSHTITVPRWELGLDYLTILYRYPQQVLPILCLVSNERQTGKSTFGVFLDMLFFENVISIGNEDMKGDFNAHFANKLIIICDETKIDSHEVIQKIKRLSTTDKIVMNAKNKDQVTVPFFAKFCLMSNSVDDFIKIDKEEVRFWVHQVPRLAKININLLAQIKDEMGAFITVLNKRQLVTKNEERHWFRTTLLETEALKKVKDNSVSTLQKRISEEITALFDSIDDTVTELKLPLKYISQLAGQKDTIYVKRELNKMNYKTIKGRHTYPVPSKTVESSVLGTTTINSIYKMETETVSGRYYLFQRADFTTDDLIENGSNYAGQDKKLIDDLPF